MMHITINNNILLSYFGTIDVQIEGTIVAPDDPNNWDPKFPRTWLDFYKLKGVLFQGHGVIDGSGSKWWASSCKKNKTNVNIGKFLLCSKHFKLQTLMMDTNFISVSS